MASVSHINIRRRIASSKQFYPYIYIFIRNTTGQAAQHDPLPGIAQHIYIYMLYTVYNYIIYKYIYSFTNLLLTRYNTTAFSIL